MPSDFAPLPDPQLNAEVARRRGWTALEACEGSPSGWLGTRPGGGVACPPYTPDFLGDEAASAELLDNPPEGMRWKLRQRSKGDWYASLHDSNNFGKLAAHATAPFTRAIAIAYCKAVPEPQP